MTFDLIVKGGRVIDGTGNPWFRADVGLCGDTICALGRLDGALARRVLNAEGRIICPGLIDIHTHADAGLLVHPRAESLVQQGITTILFGNCGLSPVPVRESTRDLLHRYIAAFIPVAEIDWSTLGDLLGRLESQGIGCNVGSLVGHGSIRIAAMGFDNRPPTDDELADMCALTEQAMRDGAFGLSSGLAYAPGMFAATGEVLALARVAARYGGLYTTHIRSEGDTWLDSINEAIQIGEQAGLPVQISHIEPHYPNWGRSTEVLALIEGARARGLDVMFDVPPYLMGMTTLTTLLPNWVQEGGISATIERLRDPMIRRRITAGEEQYSTPSAKLAADGLWDKLWLVGSERHPELTGLNLAALAQQRGQEPYDAVFDLLIEEQKQIMIVGEFHAEEDLRRVIVHPCCMIESDEGVYAAANATGRPHPRAYGTFPMILRKYVRGETRPDFPLEVGQSILRLEEALHKMTSLPAMRLGLPDRGLIREGMKADLLIFRPDEISDGATYENPHQYPRGIDWVLVNGEPVVEQGQHLGALPGRVLRKGARPSRQ